MNILAIDTSTKFLVIALGDKQGMVFGCRRDVGLRHSVLLFPLLQRLLDKYNIRKRDIDLLAVGLGPGSFTGLRV
ncbi:MAG: tRNA (adenosine(37)-N6)-threonylcarbamoyltransferase complex dimerization subunit type 1 TsaB, partial [Candidatus Omnitrophota bacterium]